MLSDQRINEGRMSSKRPQAGSATSFEALMKALGQELTDPTIVIQSLDSPHSQKLSGRSANICSTVISAEEPPTEIQEWIQNNPGGTLVFLTDDYVSHHLPGFVKNLQLKTQKIVLLQRLQELEAKTYPICSEAPRVRDVGLYNHFWPSLASSNLSIRRVLKVENGRPKGQSLLQQANDQYWQVEGLAAFALECSLDGEGMPFSCPAEYVEDQISVIVRYHEDGNLEYLDHCLFSLASQAHENMEIIVCVQATSESAIEPVQALAESFSWPSSSKLKVEFVKAQPGEDLRTRLLNRGIEKSTGRYLAFLDYDDVIYQMGYQDLIEELKNSEAAVALGRARRAIVSQEPDHLYTLTKKPAFDWGTTLLQLIHDNFVPIHSYVIDRHKIPSHHLWFDESFTCLEDYEFLLRTSRFHKFSFNKIDHPVCEYRVRADGSNTVVDEELGEVDEAKKAKWLKARDRLRVKQEGWVNIYWQGQLHDDYLVDFEDWSNMKRRIGFTVYRSLMDFIKKYPKVKDGMGDMLNLALQISNRKKRL